MAEVEPLILGLKDLHKKSSKRNASEELKSDYLDRLRIKNQYQEINQYYKSIIC